MVFVLLVSMDFGLDYVCFQDGPMCVLHRILAYFCIFMSLWNHKRSFAQDSKIISNLYKNILIYKLHIILLIAQYCVFIKYILIFIYYRIIIFRQMIKQESQDITRSSDHKSIHRKLSRKRSDASSSISNRSDTSISNFKYLRLNKNIHTSTPQNLKNQKTHKSTNISQDANSNTLPNLFPHQKVNISICTYQPSFLPNKRVFNKQDVGCSQNISYSIEKPTLKDRENNFKQTNKQMAEIQLLSRQLEAKIKQCNSLENQKCRLLRVNQQLSKNKQNIQQQNRILKDYIDTLKKRLETEQQILRRVANLGNIQLEDIHRIQTQREEYLEREIHELRNRIFQNKNSNQKMLQVELSNCKEELYKTNKTIQAMQVSNNCLQIKLKEKIEASKYLLGHDSVRIKALNKKLTQELDTIRKAYSTLQGQYQRIMESRLFAEDSFSLQYSNLV